MADYDALIAQLEAALGSGEVTVESDGDRVTYRSATEIAKAIELLERRKAARRSTVTLAAFDGN